jgi:hypothetical protein
MIIMDRAHRYLSGFLALVLMLHGTGCCGR